VHPPEHHQNRIGVAVCGFYEQYCKIRYNKGQPKALFQHTFYLTDLNHSSVYVRSGIKGNIKKPKTLKILFESDLYTLKCYKQMQ
jgi:hypothetical protein